MKRKRSCPVRDRPRKRTKEPASQCASATPPDVSLDHPVLRRLYPDVCSLRHYVLSRLPKSSKTRRRKISQLAQGQPGSSRDADDGLASILDSTLVGVLPKLSPASRDEAITERNRELLHFSQQVSEYGASSTYRSGAFLQSEIVDFVIWLLFKRSPSRRPSHLLCLGFQRSAPVKNGPAQCLPGIVATTSNTYVGTLKGSAWGRLHSLLGEAGDSIMMDLLLDCGIFYPVKGGVNNYYQISGIPLSEVKPAAEAAEVQTLSTRQAGLNGENRTLSSITFVRSRMLYARAALNAKGGVRFGMRHIHVMNRFPRLDDEQETVHIMRYIFPRQFGMHNVFTSKVDARETAMPFKDYTLREKEISHALQREIMKNSASNLAIEEQITKWKSKVPKRLRGEPVALVQKFRKLNQNCLYFELLKHYCPVECIDLSTRPAWRKNPLQPRATTVPPPNPAPTTQTEYAHDETEVPKEPQSYRTVEQTSFTDLACPSAHVSAFCRAVIAKVIPHGFWGDDENRRIILYWVDQFVCLRRFESLTLHQVTQKISISTLAWLRPPGFGTSTDKMSKTDFNKRQEIFHELVYWVFDSFLIPLIRSNFHVTESNVHRNKLFYFRHDVWRMLSEPSLASLKARMFEEMPSDKALKVLGSRPIGFSKIRLLPKKTGVRVIANLKRRQQIVRNGITVLGRSINSAMAGVFGVINYEKNLQPDKFGCSLFSVGDIHPRLSSFKHSLEQKGLSDAPLYFAKVDVQSCFDTIPQDRLLVMIEHLLSLEAYQTGKHVEMAPLGSLQRLSGDHVNPLPMKRYVPHIGAATHSPAFDSLIQDGSSKSRANTIFIDTAVQQTETKSDLMHLLREHVERNIVKIGKRFYRQKNGIPQGSILSTILCNFFYAELEREVLGFALGEDCLLMRLLDDFCLISVSKEKTERFVEVMHRRHDDYGVEVKREKSLANFDAVTDDGYRIKKRDGDKFPYCGVLIDTRTLDVSKDGGRAEQANIADSLTVDLAKVPGQSFHRKTLNAFKIQLQAMFLDTSLNSTQTVLGNLYHAFHEAAVRCAAYMRCLNNVRTTQSTHEGLLIETASSLTALAWVMLSRRTRKHNRYPIHTENARTRNTISWGQVQWLACRAFEAVFQQRQTLYGKLLAWVRKQLAQSRVSSVDVRLLERVAAGGRPRGGRRKRAA